MKETLQSYRKKLEFIKNLLHIPNLGLHEARYKLTFTATLYFCFSALFILVILSIMTVIPEDYPKRLSLATRYGLATKINQLAFPLAILISLVVIIFLNRFIPKWNVNLKLVKETLRIFEPSLLIISFLMLKYLVNRSHIDGKFTTSILHFGYGLLYDDFLRMLFNASLSLLAIAFIQALRFKQISMFAENRVREIFIGWLLPICLINSDNFINWLSSYQNPKIIQNSIFLYVVILFVSKLIFISAIYVTYNVSEQRKFQKYTSVILSFVILTVLLTRIPIKILTWRPEFQVLELGQSRFIVASCFFAMLALLIGNVKTKQLMDAPFAILGSVVFTFTYTSESVIVPELDNLHLSGENFGTWYDISSGSLIPYIDYELHRGILVNYLPAAISNFLSPGNPEAYGFAYLIYTVLFGAIFACVVSKWLPRSFTIPLLLLLPGANGYLEIDYLNFLSILYFIHYTFYRKSSIDYGLSIVIFLSTILIILAPGQGAVTALILFFIFIYSKVTSSGKRVGENKWNRLQWLFVAFSSGFFLLCSPLIFEAVKWMYQTNAANATMFGDGWVSKYLYGEIFPANLRWMIFPLIFTLIIQFASIERKLSRGEMAFCTSLLIYLILISNRWLGRLDQDTLSRLGVGMLSLCVILVIPLLFKVNKDSFSLKFFLSVTVLLAVFGNTWKPFPTIADRNSYSVNTQLNPEYVERGIKYRDTVDLIRSHFGSKSSVVNLTGGTASNFYMKLNAVGGVQTPYMVVNESQEVAWINRIKTAKPDFFLGPYGSLGGIAADRTNLFARNPLISNWLVTNTEIVECSTVIFLIPKEKWELKRDKFLDDRNCFVPRSIQESLELWNKMNGVVNDFDLALINWAKTKKMNVQVINPKLAKLQIGKEPDINFRIYCPMGNKNSKIVLQAFDDKGNAAIYEFYAALSNGFAGFDYRMFPILNLKVDKFFINLENTNCGFGLVS